MNRYLVRTLIAALALVGLGPLPAQAAPYDAMYTPAAIPTLTSGQTISVSVAVKNTGTLTWSPTGTNPVRLSYHWYRAGAVPAGSVPTTPAPNYGAVVFNGLRANLPRPIGPGETIPLTARVQAPPTPGSYTLKWDMVHENVAWFSWQGVSTKDQTVTVRSRATAAAPVGTLAATCKIIDCTPKITSVFLLSFIRPGGSVVVFGERFGGPRFPGQLRLKGLRRWDGAPVGDLPLEDLSWDDTVVGGTIPWVSGVRDQDATLQLVTKAGASNDQKVRFTAARVPDLLKGNGVIRVFCADGGLCLFGTPGLINPSISARHHGTWTTGAAGTDVYEGQLRNNWIFKSYDWLDRAGVDGGFAGFIPDSPNLYATVKWFYDAGLYSAMHYKLNIYIEGPADVPYR
jgi:hypothetical protein